MKLKIPYMNKQELSDAFSLSRSTIQHRVGEMEASGRYNDYCVIRDGQILMANVLCFADWMRYRRMWQDKNLRKYVPDYNAETVARSLGWSVDKVSLRRIAI